MVSSQTVGNRAVLRMREAVKSPRGPLPARQRKIKWGTTSFMLVNHILATVALLPQFWSWGAVVAFGVLYWVTVLGVTLGLHRLVAHRSLVVPVWLERVLVIMGTLACQSGPIDWVALRPLISSRVGNTMPSGSL